MKTLTKNVIVALCCAALLHLAFSAVVALAAQRGYPERIFDVRKISDGPHGELVGAYLASRPSDQIDTVFVGSSFTFGYPWSDEVTFASLYGKTASRRVLNVSIVGANTQDLCEDVLSELTRAGITPGTLVIEFPLINETKQVLLTDMARSIVTAPRQTDIEVDAAPRSLFNFVVRRPIGLDWIRLLWSPYARSQPERNVSITRIPDDYFASPDDFERVKGKLTTRMQTTLAMAAGVTDEVYMFVTPVYLEGVERAGSDKGNIERQLRFAQAECRRLAGEKCIDTMKLTSESTSYFNLTHLNKKGHADFAALLSNSIRLKNKIVQKY